MIKKLFPVLVFFLFAGCDKAPVNKQVESVDITYELTTNVSGFTKLRYGKFVELSNGFTGIVLIDWTVTGTGVFTHVESIRKGYVAELTAIHPVSNDWSLKIKSANGTVLRTGTVNFVTDSNYYLSTVSYPVQ
jgi:hypothetical protein